MKYVAQHQTFQRADRIASIAVSEIVQISEAAAQLRAEGKDVLSLATGEPDFLTPAHICEAATAAMVAGQTRYPPTAGTAALRDAIALKAGVTRANVIISTGAKQVLSNLFLAALNDGDEVICPAPYWTSYRDIVGFAGGFVVEVACSGEKGFKLTPEQLEQAITPKTRWLLLNSPSNPSGAMYSHAELEALGAVLRRHPHVWLASDEIYQHISYKPFTSVTDALPDLDDRTLVINGVSKAYSMTGWRIGWAIGPRAVIEAMQDVQGQSTSGACSISQAAALAAVSGNQDLLVERAAVFQDRRDRVVRAINEDPLLSCACPDGAFYVFASCEKALGKRSPGGTVLESDSDFCRFVLESEGLALVPGSAFSMPGHFRLSYAYSDAELADGIARLRSATAKLV
ncbi:pyridoxal phosphate-dependent aminotransferase [Sulfitobacter sp. F26204]|uniref:pyridoxal phosphate-dependent aminotransferase n=1 Tax=Sulfitobacter sp. F26204 TaxID=2996014 RepID=UPI00225DEA29|nr:pyridoxal phosphate-dependent aminotransferase [Sulfitobacter sp. F26204]MCX7561283.1 pyridoxal phosphate-dependent aminotransferase [Sulfitobacter sp. F26204]